MYAQDGALVFPGRYRTFRLRWQDAMHLYFYVSLWIIIFFSFPNGLNDPRTHAATIVIGAFGIWRYSWWFLNFGRSQYFGRVRYPNMRKKADAVWNAGWRPHHVHFLMTTFHEYPPTTQKCLESIFKETLACDITATLWVGTGAREDELVIKQWLQHAPDAPIDVVLIRQNQPGKRVAIGLVLRALSRRGVHPDDLAILLDGDSIFTHGSLQKCLSLFGSDPHLTALTTDEDAVCEGPAWTQKWLNMRFAQRRMWMQSHAMSKRVLTLTGRCSAFRAPPMVDKEFIRIVEADHLEHWFWGSFRFLSGDDKSTWYQLLRQGAEMTYVPDAMVYTIERIEGNGIKRAIDNTLRWSGNMLRNGLRAILLGPRVVPPFIWWCIIDQRITIWTTLMGFLSAMSVAHFINPQFIFTYILWIMVTRFAMASALYFYSERIHISYPAILYFQQLTLAFLKAYLTFRLPQQRWANRLDQKSGQDLMARRENRIFALYLNAFYGVLLTLAVLLLTGVLRWPDFQQVF